MCVLICVLVCVLMCVLICVLITGWVANAIRRATLDNFWLEKCPSLAALEWPLGKLVKMPAEADGPAGAPVPKVS